MGPHSVIVAPQVAVLTENSTLVVNIQAILSKILLIRIKTKKIFSMIEAGKKSLRSDKFHCLLVVINHPLLLDY